MDENEFWMGIWRLIAGLIICAFVFNYLGQRDLISGGFIREMVPGSSSPQWIKK